MNQGLFEAKGAQPVKPSRWKPVWTDRFFTGYVTNRSPFRSPLSAVYSEGYGLGKTDSIIDGVNVEISPRLTVIRRPGNPAYTTTTFPDSPNTFYSFKLANGTIYVIVDTATGVYQVTPTTKTLLYSKPSSAAQSNFCGVGNLLYWADGTLARAYDPINGVVRSLGIAGPVNTAPVGAQYRAFGTATNVIGPNFTAGGYVSTTTQLANNTTQSIELLAKTSGSGVQPLISFESAQTGTSPTIYQALYLSNGQLIYSYFDGTTQRSVGVGNGLNDGQWHQYGVSVQYVPDITAAVSYATNGPVKQLSAGSQNSIPDYVVTTNFTYTTSPLLSTASAPYTLQFSVWIDGVQVDTETPNTTFASGNGYWRIANTSLFPATPFQGLISEVSTRSNILTGFHERFVALMLTGDVAFVGPGITAYEAAIANGTAGLDFWWKLTEAAGTVAAESVHGVNTGTYRATLTLHQSAPVRYVTYAASTAFTSGQIIVDSNGNLQSVNTAGTSGSVAPAWATSIGQATSDGSVVWSCLGPGSINGRLGGKYCYSFVNKYGHFSTASPLSGGLVNIAPQELMSFQGISSTDPQVAYIAIFRTVDGGTTPFFVDMIPNNSSGAAWTFIDATPDSGLNILMAAPQAHSNDTAPQGLKSLAFHLGRVWGAVGSVLYASGGPDTLVGNGNEAWPPANSWNYPSQILRLVPHSTGLLVFTLSGIFMHAGGPAIPQFYPQPLFEKVGVSNWNALDASMNEVTLFSSGKQLLTIDLLNNTLTDIGFNIQDQLQSLDPTKVYVVRHHGGLDDAVFVGDGSTGWFKCVTRQPPDHTITGPVWSPNAQVNP